MNRFGVGIWRSFVAFVAFRMTNIIVVTAECDDPGRPINGGRTVSSEDGRFPAGTVISFYCNALYTLVGAKKITCSVLKNTYHWNGKVPKCYSQAKGCPMPPPLFPHANITTHPVPHSKGSRVDYTCMDGYECDGCSTSVLCDKDPSLGYRWSGNFTCKKKTCGHPEYPSTGHGSYILSDYDTYVYARYYCYAGYVLLKSHMWLLISMSRTCNKQRGTWSSSTPACVKTCNATTIQLDHGKRSRNPHYNSSSQAYAYTQGVEVTFDCDDRYKLEGSSKRRCLENGQWDGAQPRCVINRCRSPGDEISNGYRTFNVSIQSLFPIWTTVTFKCHDGYELHGHRIRQCRPGGEWNGTNPTCRKSPVKCSRPSSIRNGNHTNFHKEPYSLNEQIIYWCTDSYYLWGEKSWVCRNSHVQGQGIWRTVSCFASEYCTSTAPPNCLPPNLFDEECLRTRGTHARFNERKAWCLQAETTPAGQISTLKFSSYRELDKMTIVVATAGSTLGALVLLLTALVCFRRFHRGRRFRHSTFRSRRYSDEDRIAIIAAYTGDVHFILPSYDEAVSQVQSQPPPPFESVVQGAEGGDNQTPPGNNNPTVDVASISTSEANDSVANTREVGPSTNENQPINIVRNPLVEGLHAASETVASDHGMSATNECGVHLSEESLDTIDIVLSPNNPSADLASSSSEDDLTSSQSRPLLGNGRRGVIL